MNEHFAWPIAAVVIALVFLFLFRRPIERFLDRTKKISRTGVETGEAPQLPASAGQTEAALSAYLSTYDNALLKEREASIAEDLKQRGLAADPSASNRALTRSLAAAQIFVVFEQLINRIYSSQLVALTYLNTKSGPVPLAEIETSYTTAAASYPDLYRERTFDDWIGFMRSFNLLVISGDRVEATPLAREFMKWLIENRRPWPTHG